MPCNKCCNTCGVLDDSPLEKLETLFKNTYDEKEVFTHKCKFCHDLFIGLSIDDCRFYWVPVSYREIHDLLGLKGMPELFPSVCKLIEGKTNHISADATGHYSYKEEPAVVL